jgi:hypothetical protein
LDSTFQIADEGAIKASFQVEFHLRQPKLFSHRPHDFTKCPLHTSPGLNLFSTFGHLRTNGAPLSAVGQRALTDNLSENTTPEEQ